MQEKFLQEIKEKNIICDRPWSYLEIEQDGRVFCCCPAYTDSYCFGNILEQSFDEIWNGEKWTEFRKDILENKYSHCNLDLCYGIEQPCFINKENLPVDKYPTRVNLNMDSACNLACIFCRDKIKRPYPKYYKKYNFLNNFRNKIASFLHIKQNYSEDEEYIQNLIEEANLLKKNIDKIDSFYIPMLKNAKTLLLNGEGEFFVSRFYKELLQKSSKLYPDLKYQLLTNGLLCTEKNLKEFGILDKLDIVIVSVHAATEETYNKVIKYSDFNKVINNIKYLSELKIQNKLSDLILTFVITSVNYKEIPDFVKLSYSLNAKPQFWAVRLEQDCKLCNEEFDKYDVSNPNHPEHQEYLKVLQDPVFEKYKIITNGLISSCNDKIQNILE